MVRSPCCEKAGLKKGPWTPEEDQKLLAYIQEHGHGSWRALPAKAGLQRCGKSCRLRWTNYLRPDIKRGKFSLQEEQTIIQLHALLGNRWSAIATHLPKRTDNEIKNYWNTHIKKRLDKMGIDPVTHKPKTDAFISGSGNTKDAANLSHMAQWESARLEAEARLVRESKIIQTQLIPPPPSAHQLPTKTSVHQRSARPQCLDVLKAWQGVVSGMFFASSGESLESPTSTLNFCENALPIPADGFLHDQNFSTSSLEFVTNGGGALVMDNAWVSQEAATAAATMENRNNNVMQGVLSDVLVYSTTNSDNNGQNTSLAAADNGNVNLIMEENKDYWNSLLNLVDASISAGCSQMF